jgi:hypothetical protein
VVAPRAQAPRIEGELFADQTTVKHVFIGGAAMKIDPPRPAR